MNIINAAHALRRRVAWLLLLLLAGDLMRAQDAPVPSEAARYQALEWRNIGPFRGGRVTASEWKPVGLGGTHMIEMKRRKECWSLAETSSAFIWREYERLFLETARGAEYQPTHDTIPNSYYYRAV